MIDEKDLGRYEGKNSDGKKMYAIMRRSTFGSDESYVYSYGAIGLPPISEQYKSEEQAAETIRAIKGNGFRLVEKGEDVLVTEAASQDVMDFKSWLAGDTI